MDDVVDALAQEVILKSQDNASVPGGCRQHDYMNCRQHTNGVYKLAINDGQMMAHFSYTVNHKLLLVVILLIRAADNHA